MITVIIPTTLIESAELKSTDVLGGEIFQIKIKEATTYHL